MIDTETGEIKGKRPAHTKEEFREFIGDRAGTKMDSAMSRLVQEA
jgi:hypothetical protein